MTTLQSRTDGTVLRPVRPSVTLVKLCGEIDVFTCHSLRERLIGAVRSSVGPLILDLSRVSFRDVSGLAALVGVQRRARARGIALYLAEPSSQTAELLRLTGLDRVLMIYRGIPGKPGTPRLPRQVRRGD
ncbi:MULTISPECIES: STAS domain-containing protein [Streptosporangium]|uniref:Anti-sigma factor antagonist n=1 Tax=Streptosporangium brasiliense TaxID=47480 RepID=A0ABT9R1J4_9ACTN|nr:STAS domain-containing protein [Streptosporangium brasiliense]MDP9863098.1 anti-sigma B factor antagonist [Streptosporangium brasiliense]